MPLAVLRSYIRVLPRVRAEASLTRVSEALVASGNMEKRAAERLLAEWETDAQTGQAYKRHQSEEEHREYLAESGFFDVEVVSG